MRNRTVSAEFIRTFTIKTSSDCARSLRWRGVVAPSSSGSSIKTMAMATTRSGPGLYIQEAVFLPFT